MSGMLELVSNAVAGRAANRVLELIEKGYLVFRDGKYRILGARCNFRSRLAGESDAHDIYEFCRTVFETPGTYTKEEIWTEWLRHGSAIVRVCEREVPGTGRFEIVGYVCLFLLDEGAYARLRSGMTRGGLHYDGIRSEHVRHSVAALHRTDLLDQSCVFILDALTYYNKSFILPNAEVKDDFTAKMVRLEVELALEWLLPRMAPRQCIGLLGASGFGRGACKAAGLSPIDRYRPHFPGCEFYEVTQHELQKRFAPLRGRFPHYSLTGEMRISGRQIQRAMRQSARLASEFGRAA